MSRRKSQKGMRKHRRRGAGFLLSLFTFIIVTGAILASVTAFMQVAKIEVNGVTRHTPEELIQASEIKLGSNMFLINKFEVSDKIIKKFPYIKQVRISRRLPDTFVFEVEERYPAGYIISEERWWLVDRYGYLLEAFNAGAELSVPRVIGGTLMAPSPGTKAVLKEPEYISALTTVLEGLFTGCKISDVGWVNISKLYELEFSYQNRFRVILGSSGGIDQKISMLNAVVGQVGEFDRGTIYLSDTGRPSFLPNAALSVDPPEPAPVIDTKH